MENMKKQHQPNSEKIPYCVGRESITYKDVKTDEDGWADASMYLPMSYDLVKMVTETGRISGWWDGSSWEGLKLTKKDKVLAWKVIKQEGFNVCN